MSRASRSLIARGYSARLRRWKLRAPGDGLAGRVGVDPSLEGRGHVGQRRAVRALGAGRRHHLGAQLADRPSRPARGRRGAGRRRRRPATGHRPCRARCGRWRSTASRWRCAHRRRRPAPPESWSAAAPAARRALRARAGEGADDAGAATACAARRSGTAPSRACTAANHARVAATIAVGSATCTNLGIETPRRGGGHPIAPRDSCPYSTRRVAGPDVTSRDDPARFQGGLLPPQRSRRCPGGVD